MKLYTTIVFLCFGIFMGIAQKRQSKEKIKQLKIAYFTEKLDFSTDEAQQFWPIYNAYDDKNHELRVTGFHKIKKEVEDMDQMSESEASEILARLEKLEDEMHENKKALMKKLKKILSAKKIIHLKKVEREFNRELMKQFRNKRGKRKSMP
ncbi:sensor of ECF-type sigma factor [Kordia sp.]|uniref:sensor of ECF-type sigma factor n=1 Tax=Kordia sp. TaxID=1965332 RepID=UPI003D6A7935